MTESNGTVVYGRVPKRKDDETKGHPSSGVSVRECDLTVDGISGRKRGVTKSFNDIKTVLKDIHKRMMEQ